MENVKQDISIEPFSVYIWRSGIVHIVLFIALTIKTVFFPAEPLTLQEAIRVDIVDLPEKFLAIEDPTPQHQIKDPLKELRDTQPPMEKTFNPKVNKKMQSDALKRLDAFNRLEQEVKQDNQKELQKKTQKKSPSYKGNVLSGGSELKGIQRLEYDDYVMQIKKHINKNFILPEWISRQNLNCSIHIRIDDNGYVIEKAIVNSSHNSQYDELSLTAVIKASPFPKPSSKLAYFFSSSGIIIHFP